MNQLIQYGFCTCNEEWRVQSECALFCRIYYICEGEAHFISDQEKIVLKSGILYLFPTLQTYSIYQNKENPLTVLWFHVKADIKMNVLQSYAINSNMPEFYIIHALKIAIFDENKDRIDAYFRNGLKLLLDRVNINNTYTEEMSKIVNYIDEHLSGIKVARIAKYMGMERSYFSRKFKLLFQVSPNYYIQNRRISEAVILLNLGLSVSLTADKMGYQDEKSFSRAFKNKMGISPSEYKKSHIQQP